MEIYGVSFDMVGKQPIILLKTQSGNRYLPIWIGSAEATAIMTRLQGVETPRPMTHDLLSNVVRQLHGEVIKVSVTELRENTFIAAITLKTDAEEIEIDARPSDALALAVREDVPIFAAESVIADSALEFIPDAQSSDDVVEKFREFLDDVSPEDFAG